jgi:hypothetical protein
MVIPFVHKADNAKPNQAAGFQLPAAPAAEPVALVGHTDPWSWLLAASLKIDLWRLARFNELMGQQRLPLQLGKMFRDPAYAFERLSMAHGSGQDELKALALEMFEQYLQLERRRRSPDSPISPFSPSH